MMIAIAQGVGCKQTASKNPTPPAAAPNSHLTNDQSWDVFLDGYINNYFIARPDIAVLAGRHDLDGRLPDFSAAGLQREAERLRGAKERARSFANDALDGRQRFERDYLISRIDSDLFWLESAAWPAKNPYYYADALDPDVYISRDYAPLDQRMRAFINYAKAIPDALKQARGNLKPPFPRTFIKIGRTTIGGLAATYETDVTKIFAPVADEQLKSEFRAATSVAATAVREFDGWLASLEQDAPRISPSGRKSLARCCGPPRALAFRLINWKLSGDEIWSETSRPCAKRARVMRPVKSVRECVAKQQLNKPEGGAVEERETSSRT
ncbi:MAG: DUF885 family protein [Pyrinomonadaceae bacterium]